MRETFTGWYGPGDEEIDAIWTDAMVVLDTNILLDFYRLTKASRESLVKALGSVADRLWIPHQVGLEFHKARDGARTDLRNRHTLLADKVVSSARKLVKEVKELRSYNPAIDEDNSLRTNFVDSAEALAGELKAGLEEYDDAEEEVMDQLEKLFPEQRIGKPFSTEDLQAARDEAADRFSRKTPPGFADAGKDGDLRYGDYFLWKQLMARAAELRTGVIFITRDEKEDWRRAGKILPELAQEFYERTKTHILILNPDTFVRESSDRNLWQVDEQDDVQRVADEYKEVERVDAAGLRRASYMNASTVEAIRRMFDNVNYDAIADPVRMNKFQVDPKILEQFGQTFKSAGWAKYAADLSAAAAALTPEIGPGKLDEDGEEQEHDDE